VLRQGWQSRDRARRFQHRRLAPTKTLKFGNGGSNVNRRTSRFPQEAPDRCKAIAADHSGCRPAGDASHPRRTTGVSATCSCPRVLAKVQACATGLHHCIPQARHVSASGSELSFCTCSLKCGVGKSPSRIKLVISPVAGIHGCRMRLVPMGKHAPSAPDDGNVFLCRLSTQASLTSASGCLYQVLFATAHRPVHQRGAAMFRRRPGRESSLQRRRSTSSIGKTGSDRRRNFPIFQTKTASRYSTDEAWVKTTPLPLYCTVKKGVPETSDSPPTEDIDHNREPLRLGWCNMALRLAEYGASLSKSCNLSARTRENDILDPGRGQSGLKTVAARQLYRAAGRWPQGG